MVGFHQLYLPENILTDTPTGDPTDKLMSMVDHYSNPGDTGSNDFFFFLLWLIFRLCVRAHACPSLCVELREQLAGICSLPLLCGFWGVAGSVTC